MPTCSNCTKSISSIRGLFSHMTVVHRDLSFIQFECVDCPQRRQFSSTNSYRKHLQKEHNFPIVQRTFKSDNIAECPAGMVVRNSVPLDAALDTKLQKDAGPSDFSEALRRQAEMFVAKLYSNPRLPRNLVQQSIEDINLFLGSGFLNILEEIVMRTIANTCVSSENVSAIKAMFRHLGSPFAHLKTEHGRLKHFTNCGDFIAPEAYVIGHQFRTEKVKGRVVGKNMEMCGQFVPLKRTLKRFFELPNALSDTLSYIESLKREPNVVQNFIQSPLWFMKRQPYKITDIVFPLFIFFDDVEKNNPLGSRSCKVGAVYASVPCLPPECSSTLKNLFLVLLFESTYRKEYGNKKTFDPLIQELKYLEQHGITVNSSDGPRKVFFVLGLLLGDNLGLNGMLGMVESFTATYFCRFCKMTKKESENCCIEQPALMRDPINYKEDTAIINPKESGIKELCVFNEIPSFHMTQNYCVDEMHDTREGVCQRSMLLILTGLTSGTHISFDLDTLNSRLLLFDYGPIDNRNKPPCISADSLKGSKLKMTAAETTCFVKLFGVIIGDLVSDNDPYWKLYISLREILDLTYAKRIPKNVNALLRVLIQEHLELYKQLAGPTLKPKHHFLTHYPRILTESGPIMNLSSIRYEAKHKDLTQAAAPNKSRVNIAHSLAVKHQLNMCYRFQSNEKITANLFVGPGQTIVLTEDLAYFGMLQTVLPQRNNAFSPKWVEFKGTVFKAGMVVVVSAEYLCPRLAEIRLIFVGENNCPIFVCTYLENQGLSRHVWGYQVKATDKYACVKCDELLDPLPLSTYTMSNGEKYVIFRVVLLL